MFRFREYFNSVLFCLPRYLFRLAEASTGRRRGEEESNSDYFFSRLRNQQQQQLGSVRSWRQPPLPPTRTNPQQLPPRQQPPKKLPPKQLPTALLPPLSAHPHKQTNTVAGESVARQPVESGPRGGRHLPEHFRIIHFETLPPREVLF